MTLIFSWVEMSWEFTYLFKYVCFVKKFARALINWTQLRSSGAVTSPKGGANI